MPRKVKDKLKGMLYGSLDVLGLTKNEVGHSVWICQCLCGNQVTVLNRDLVNGRRTSCGCKQHGKSGKDSGTYKHGMSNAPEHRTWMAMNSRCTDSNSKPYKWYGGRGISVCERWGTFDAFYEDMGPRPDGTSIDRIDVNGNYEPGNCRWANDLIQGRNRRNVIVMEYGGEKKTLREWAVDAGIKSTTLYNRLNIGWSMSKALYSPLVKGRPK